MGDFRFGLPGFAAGCVLAIIAERTDAEHIHHHVKDAAVERAVAVAIAGADAWSSRPAP